MTYRFADADFTANLSKTLNERIAYFNSLSDRDPRKAKGIEGANKLVASMTHLEKVFGQSLEGLLNDKAVMLHEQIAKAINPKGQFSAEQVASVFNDMHHDLNKVNDGYESAELQLYAEKTIPQGSLSRLNLHRVDALRTVIKQFTAQSEEPLDDRTIDQYATLQRVLQRAESYGANLVAQALPTGDRIQDGELLKSNVTSAKRIAYALQEVISDTYAPCLKRVESFANALTNETNKLMGKGQGIAG
jgi:hypothetical protein